MGCCKAFTAKCVACARGVSVEQICSDPASAKLPGCHGVSEEVQHASSESTKCCWALTAQCMSCWKGMSMEEFCASPVSAVVPGCASSGLPMNQAHQQDSAKMCCR